MKHAFIFIGGLLKIIFPLIFNVCHLVFLILSLIVVFIMDVLFIMWHFRIPDRFDNRSIDVEPSWDCISEFMRCIRTFTWQSFLKAFFTSVPVFMREQE